MATESKNPLSPLDEKNGAGEERVSEGTSEYLQKLNGSGVQGPIRPPAISFLT